MRKLFPMLLFTLLLALLMAFPALAADFTYDDFSATLTVPDSYTMLTTSNLADHEDLLAKQGLTVEAAQGGWGGGGPLGGKTGGWRLSDTGPDAKEDFL